MPVLTSHVFVQFRASKTLDGLPAHHFHVSGVLNHGGSTKATVFLWDDRWPHDPNAFLETLVRTLKAELEAKGKLKDVLYIQLDNAPNTNKNKFVLFFCALLVAWKLFRKVKVSFLLVGHTHEDIDQMFSRFAEALRRADVTSWQQMASLFRNSFTFDLEPPTVHFKKDVYDYKAWMAPHMPKIKNHTEPMCFKMELDATSNHVRVFARHTMSGSKREATHWQPAEGYQLVTNNSLQTDPGYRGPRGEIRPNPAII